MVVSCDCISKLTQDRPSASASARLPNANAIFSRDGNAAELCIDVRTPAVSAEFYCGRLEEAVAHCCEQEIEFVRTTFDKLGGLLSEQLDDRGDRARIDDTVEWRENRTWNIGGSDFKVAGTLQQATSQVELANAPSDAALAREMIRLQLSGRLLAIRDVYRQMLNDLFYPTGDPSPKIRA